MSLLCHVFATINAIYFAAKSNNVLIIPGKHLNWTANSDMCAHGVHMYATFCETLNVFGSAWKGDGVCEVLDLNFTMAAEVGYERSLEIFALRHADDLPFAAIPCSERAFDSSEALTVVSKVGGTRSNQLDQ